MFLAKFNYDMCAVCIQQDEENTTTLMLTADNTVSRSVRDSAVKGVIYKATEFTSFYAAVKDMRFHEDSKIDNAIKQQIIAFDDFCDLPR